jgi:hypothetical protein
MTNNLERAKKIGNWISAILLGDTRELIARIDERTIRMEKDLDEMRPMVWKMYPKVEALWRDRGAPSNSPRQLNERGTAILEQSRIKHIVEEKRGQLLALVKATNPTNAYDAEQAVFKVMNDLQTHFPEVEDKLKDGAFKAGEDIPMLLFVGGVYLRNLIFKDLGFTLEPAQHLPQARTSIF